MELSGQAAVTLKTIWADPVQTGNTLYVTHAYRGEIMGSELEVI